MPLSINPEWEAHVAWATEVAWAAGFFDGEGCTCFYVNNRNKTRRLTLSVSQNDRKVLDRFQEAVGGFGKVYGPHMNGSRYQWMISALGDVEVVVETLWPYLSTVKREQASKALSDYETHSLKRKAS